MDGGNNKIMLDKYTYSWTIDDVLQPNSAFWKKMYSDIKSRPETGMETIEKGMWYEKISEFLDYFKTKPKSAGKILSEDDILLGSLEDIGDTEHVLINALWGLINETDKETLFHNDIEYFNDWIDSCPSPLLDEYVRRLSAGEGLLEVPKTANKMVNDNIRNTINNSNSPSSCNVTISGGKLILCSTNHITLKKLKNIMVKQGNKLQAYKEEKTIGNKIIHSYIFEVKSTN